MLSSTSRLSAVRIRRPADHPGTTRDGLIAFVSAEEARAAGRQVVRDVPLGVPLRVVSRRTAD